jgi:hypothetical protein
LRAKDDGFEDATDAEITVDDEAEMSPSLQSTRKILKSGRVRPFHA